MEPPGAVVWRAPAGPSVLVGSKPEEWPESAALDAGAHEFSRAENGSWGASRRIGALAMHDARARDRAEVAFVAMNWWPPQEDGDPFVPEMMARGEGWAQLRDLPMWEASMAGMIATAWAHRTKTVREMSNE